MNTVTLDVETKRWFKGGEKRDHRKLGVSFVGVYEEGEDRLHGFFEGEISKLWPIVEKADLIIGYNILKFDYPVLAPYYSGDLYKLPTLDLMVAAQEAVGFRLKLNDLAKATLGERKNRPGSEAVWLYEQGKLNELAQYCLNDVKLTYSLYATVRHGQPLKFFNEKGEEKEFRLDLERFVAERPEANQADIQMSLEV